MTALAKNTFGVLLKLGASPGTPATVAELTSINAPSLSRETIDATTHDGASAAMEYIADGVYDAGEIQCEGHLIAGSTADDLFVGAVTGGTLMDFEVHIKAATGFEKISGKCFVTSYEPGDLPVKGGKQTFSATMKVTGALTQAAVV